MPTIIPYLIAGVSTTAFLTLWFWVVRRELLAKQNMVQNAEEQLLACRKNYLQSKDGVGEMDAENILIRSQDIYVQSITLHNQTLRKPWNLIPGYIMGFHIIPEKNP